MIPMYVAKSENFRYIGMASECRFPMYVIIGFIVNTSERRKSRQSRCTLTSKSIKIKDIYTEVPSEYSVYEYRLFLLYFCMKRPYGLIIITMKELLYQKYTKEYKLYDI